MDRSNEYAKNAAAMAADGRAPLRLGRASLRLICHALAAAQNASNAPVLKRLTADAGLIEALLCDIRALPRLRLPSVHGTPRILIFARNLVRGGEWRPDLARLTEAAQAFDARCEAEMDEILCLPDALRIALAEALAQAAQTAVACGQSAARARAWAENGRSRLDAEDPVFVERAAKLCAEEELSARTARLEQAMAARGAKLLDAMEAAQRIYADCILKIDNLMRLHALLNETDWMACFERVSTAEGELNADPAGVYPNMDAQSRARLRRAVAALARTGHVSEAALIRCAQIEAGRAMEGAGADDARATLCYYFWGDEGRAELMRAAGQKVRLRRRIPDPSGRLSAALLILAALVSAAAIVLAAGRWIYTLYALPLGWALGSALICRVYPRFVRPNSLLRMQVERVPDSARTLVTLPVLLSAPARADEMLEKMEALGCLERDENIDFLLLGDFRDGAQAHERDDDEILNRARAGVARLNAKAGREKYFYLQREREYRAQDDRWMGRNRKRGAMVALNRLLLGEDGAAADFAAESAAAPRLAGRYAYVVTLDEDTRYLPGTVQRLLGAMLHPLNRTRRDAQGRRHGYAVLQPAMQLTARAVQTGYAACMYGAGGVDGYPFSISDFYQDMSGRGNFAGKGIYEVRAFYEATQDRLNDDAILSHDLIEGILSGAGFLNDVALYDGCPTRLQADLLRLHRWTRGDWQLLPALFSRLGLDGLDRLKIIGNLLRSLYAPALLLMLLHALWADAQGAFMAALLIAFREPLLSLLHGGAQAWRRALLSLAVLPQTALCMLDAVLRTLWRLLVSQKHLMEWVPAADAAQVVRDVRLPGRVAAILALPGALRPFWLPAALALAGLFWVGAGRADDLAERDAHCAPKLDPASLALLSDAARRTWHFFEVCVPASGVGLPPDNLQLDPAAGLAMRTSPTNIGFYLIACAAARQLGFIRDDEMLKRMRGCTDTLERLEKWRGQLYNWYDLNTLAPLRPRYVSAVDSGNLAGALLLCAQYVSAADAELSERLMQLAAGMELRALYDAERDLFHIGMDVEGGRMSASHYDLYASEARLLSYVAIMLGQAPVKHWQRLSRPALRTDGAWTLASWSGTMFEYLMPDIWMPAPENTLATEMQRGALDAQQRWARRLGRPWGVSESGYYAFDLHLNYQYRAFGLREAALCSDVSAAVVAPYASVLALWLAPDAAARNMARMQELGWLGEYGFCEAADYAHLNADGMPSLVASHMAHHQGMILASICNFLSNGALSACFMRLPAARALELLLQEKPCVRPRRRVARHSQPDGAPVRRADAQYQRAARGETDRQLLCGAGTYAAVSGCGEVRVWTNEMLLTRENGEGLYLHLCDLDSGARTVLGRSGRIIYGMGAAEIRETLGELEARLRIYISPETGALYQQVTLENRAAEARSAVLTGCMAAALAPEGDMRAHPAFQNLFVRSALAGDCAVKLWRRARGGESKRLGMCYGATGGTLEFETDRERLTGRTGHVGRAGGIAMPLSNTVGAVLDPCAAIAVRATLAAGARAEICFTLLPDADAQGFDALLTPEAQARAARMAAAHAMALMNYLEMDGRMVKLAQRAAALLLQPRLRTPNGAPGADGVPVSREALWRVGISGDHPILLAEMPADSAQLQVRDVVKLCRFYREMGLKTDLVLMSRQAGDYQQAQLRMLNDLLPENDGRGASVAVDAAQLNEGSLMALRRCAALRFEGSVWETLADAAEALLVPAAEPFLPMEPGHMEFGALECFNGYGGFDGDSYVIQIEPDRLPPAAWSNIIAAETAGAVLTERGGGFAWFGNSRAGRLTAFKNDAQREGWGWMFYIADLQRRRFVRLLPGDIPMTPFCVRFQPGLCVYRGAAAALNFEVAVRPAAHGLWFEIELENSSDDDAEYTLCGCVDWLMGTDAADTAALRSWSRFGSCLAAGMAAGVGVFASDDPRARPGCALPQFYAGGDMMEPRGFDRDHADGSGFLLRQPMRIPAGKRRRARFLLGAAENEAAACALARDFRAQRTPPRPELDWKRAMDALRVETPDARVNHLFGGFLQAQTLHARILARTGLYQPGGAYGFRDQLQDMLSVLWYEPARVRRHLLYCAARQFEAGDVLHWWHEPYTGVRTRISDDLLFLPYVTAAYVLHTGDAAVLGDCAPFLRDMRIPDDREDVYARMQPDDACASLHEHCMRAFRRAAQRGAHGLCLMGGGDWNDGMNRVGARGLGESVWLTEFWVACAEKYMEVCPETADRAWLEAQRGDFAAALEKNAWDGQWYLRAYADGGECLGSADSPCCRIDLVSQAWAVLAGLDKARCRSAIDAAWDQLVDEKLGLIRLLAPPFTGEGFDPGYIAAYPAGIRENGAQYTHGACWMLCALARLGDAFRAHAALRMLLPVDHSDSRAAADIYRVEPYVMAADVYTDSLHPGRGGWTWYTGSAAWMQLALYEMLGLEKRGGCVRMNALLDKWPFARVRMRCGAAVYTLETRQDAERVTLDGVPVEGDHIEMIDDGREHLAVFPPRRKNS